MSIYNFIKNNGFSNVFMGMSMKPNTMTQGETFSIGRKNYRENIGETYYGKVKNNDASSQIYKKKMNAIGKSSVNRNSNTFSFTNVDKNIVNSKIRQVRGSGYVAPAKKGK